MNGHGGYATYCLNHHHHVVVPKFWYFLRKQLKYIRGIRACVAIVECKLNIYKNLNIYIFKIYSQKMHTAAKSN